MEKDNNYIYKYWYKGTIENLKVKFEGEIRGERPDDRTGWGPSELSEKVEKFLLRKHPNLKPISKDGWTEGATIQFMRGKTKALRKKLGLPQYERAKQ